MTKKNGANAPRGSACPESTENAFRAAMQCIFGHLNWLPVADSTIHRPAIDLELRDLLPAELDDKQCQHLREMLEKERQAEYRVICIAYESTYRCEYLSDKEIARLALAQKRIARIDQQLVALGGPEWGVQ